MVSGGVYIRYFVYTETNIKLKAFRDFPLSIKNWRYERDILLSKEVVRTLKVDEYLFREFHNGNRRVDLYIGYYQSHRRFAEIHTPEHCQAGGGWEVITKRVKHFDIPGENIKIKAVEAVYKKDIEKRVFIYWYQVSNRYITDFFSYKIHIILNSLLRHRSDAAFVRITAPVYEDNTEEAIMRAEDFLIKAVPVINGFLP